MALQELRGLEKFVSDVAEAECLSDHGAPEPWDFDLLLERLHRAEGILPPQYEKQLYEPYVKWLASGVRGRMRFNKILASDRNLDEKGGAMLDMAQAILQRTEQKYLVQSTAAFQEVVSDLYDGFLSAEDRQRVPAPSPSTLAPMVKWGSSGSGAYTFPVDLLSYFRFKVRVAIVNLPSANATRGLAAWAAIAHETVGHDVIGATSGLLKEIRQKVHSALKVAKIPKQLSRYWAERMDETASDVLGILNMGPAAGIGVVAYLRGINQACGYPAKLSARGPGSDPHPADILRGHLAAATVRLLNFREAPAWADLLRNETLADAKTVYVERHCVSADQAEQSATIIANTLTKSAFSTLGGHCFAEIQNWSDDDEAVVRQLRKILAEKQALPARFAVGCYAAHAVAAAVYEAVFIGHDLARLQRRLIEALASMHDRNPSWHPPFVAHPGDVKKRRSRG